MKLCLLFHCLCASYEDVSGFQPELFVSLDDLEDMILEMKGRGFNFGPLDQDGNRTATISFDDGYYNNVLFGPLAKEYAIPYLLFISAYYCKSGAVYPWFLNDGPPDAGTLTFDYYQHFENLSDAPHPEDTDESVRPMSFLEVRDLLDSDLAEIGCHGYYHQPLTQEFEHFMRPERDRSMDCLYDALGVKPRYYSFANGAYTKGVLKELLETFERVFTIEGRAYHRDSKVIHRITLLNPTVAGPLVQQIDQHLKPLRQMRRAVRSFSRLHL